MTLLALLLSAACRAQTVEASVDTFEMVQSVPEATTLAQPGLPRTHDVWLAMLDKARHRIDIAAFYISNKKGEPLEPILASLIERSRAGVKVRVLLDQTFMPQSKPSLGVLQNVPNLTIRVLPVDALTGGVQHAKFFVVDGHDVFVGSQNLDWRSFQQIHELGVHIDNRRFAQTYAAVFDSLWQAADAIGTHASRAKKPGQVRKPRGFDAVTADHPVTLHDALGHAVVAWPAFSPPALMPAWLDSEQTQLLRLINGARDVLRIQVMTMSAWPEFGPRHYWPVLDNALREAAVRGVKVKIIVADWALKQPMQAYLKSLAVLPGIEVRFSQLPPSPRGFIDYARVEHCKYAVADDEAIYISTGNWGWDYFNASVDTSVFAHGAHVAGVLKDLFERDWTGAYTHALDPGRDYASPQR